MTRLCPWDIFLANFSVSKGVFYPLSTFWRTIWVYLDTLIPRSQIRCKPSFIARIWLYLGVFRSTEHVFEDCFGRERHADAKETIYLQIWIYPLHGKKDSQENHVLNKRCLRCPVPGTFNRRAHVVSWLVASRHVVSLVRSLQIVENGSENLIVCSLSSMRSQYNRSLAANPQVYRELRVDRHCRTKQMFFENVVFLW